MSNHTDPVPTNDPSSSRHPERPVNRDQTVDHAPESPAPDETTNLPAPGPAGAPDTVGGIDTSAATDPNRTGLHTPAVSFDPYRTGLHTPADSPDEPTHPEPTVPGYEILGELGRGGMGVVYRARQTALDRVIALKMILAGPHASRAIIARFLAEAQAVAQLQHPNIVQIHEVGEFAGMPYFSLEFVDGAPLSKTIAREPQPPAFAARLIEQLARAVQYAHDRGIVHRDLKPANVLVARDGAPKLTDFGLAKRLEADSGQTQSGQVLGTPSYMAPEQARGEVERVGPLADVWGLGAILYDLLTGRPPFAGSSVLDTLEMVRTRDPVSPGQLAAKVPRDLETICLKCLEKDPARRYPSAGALADDVRRFLDDRPIVARPVGPAGQAWRWAKRNRAVAALLAAVFVTLTAGVSGTTAAMLNAQDKRREAEEALDAKDKALFAEAQAKQKAEDERDLKEKARAGEEAARHKAQAERDEKEKARAAALNTLRTVLLRIDDRMRDSAALAPVRLQVIDTVLADLDVIRDGAVENPLVDRTTAIAYSRIGETYLRSNRVQDAAVWYRKAHGVLKTLADATPDDPVAMRNLAAISNQLADAEWRLGNPVKARDLYAAALKLRQERVRVLESQFKQKKADAQAVLAARFDVADSHRLIGLANLRLGDATTAVGDYTAADKAFAALPPAWRDTLQVRRLRADIQVRLGDARFRLGHRADAEKHYRDALGERLKLLEITPRPADAVAALKTDIGQSRLYLGDFLLVVSGAEPAAAEYAAALALFDALLKDHPDSLAYRRLVAAIRYRLGVVAQLRSGAAAATGSALGVGESRWHLTECLRLREGLAKIDPKDTQGKVEWMLALARVGDVPRVEGLARELLDQAEADPAVRFQVACGLAVAAGVATDPEVAARCKDRAFEVLGGLTRVGWKDRGALEVEPDLDGLRGDKRFAELLLELSRPGGK